MSTRYPECGPGRPRPCATSDYSSTSFRPCTRWTRAKPSRQSSSASSIATISPRAIPKRTSNGSPTWTDSSEAPGASRRKNPRADLVEFLESVGLVGDADQRDDESDLVTVMTLHAAKGLEFPVVFLLAFEQDVLPHERAVREGDVEEERRLAFVGITRAREELTISYTQRRFYRGQTTAPAPSTFLVELPSESVRREDVIHPTRSLRDFDDDYSQESPYEEPSIQVVQRAGDVSGADRFRRGMMVRHPRYGPGQVLQIEGTGSGRKATIHFPTVGTKRFVLSKSPLQPVS